MGLGMGVGYIDVHMLIKTDSLHTEHLNFVLKTDSLHTEHSQLCFGCKMCLQVKKLAGILWTTH